jgi:hypothetical protein
MDATGSRQATWDMAVELQAEMLSQITGLDLQLFFYRGGKHANSVWVSSPRRLANIMRGIVCQAGQTNIASVLEHACEETKKSKVDALVFIGDAFEEELDLLAPIARELGRLGLRVSGNQYAGQRRRRQSCVRLPADRRVDPWRLLPIRCRCCTSVGGVASHRRGLRAGDTKVLAAKPSVAGWLSYGGSHD